MFYFSFVDDTLLKALAISLNDFSSFDQMSPIAYLLEVLHFTRFCNQSLRTQTVRQSKLEAEWERVTFVLFLLLIGRESGLVRTKVVISFRYSSENRSKYNSSGRFACLLIMYLDPEIVLALHI